MVNSILTLSSVTINAKPEMALRFAGQRAKDRLRAHFHPPPGVINANLHRNADRDRYSEDTQSYRGE
jgi:hypothetical protein